MKKALLFDLTRRNDFRGVWELLRLSVRRRVSGMTAYRPEVYYRAVDSSERLDFDLQTDPLVSVVVPAHDHWEYTYSCLYAISQNTAEMPYEVIVGDDCSTDETKNILDHIGGIRVVRNGENLGFLRTCNSAASKAAGKYILFLNNDTNVQHGWLDALVDLIEKDNRVGLVGSKLVYPDGRLQDAGGILWNDGSCWIYGRWDDPQKEKYNSAREVDYLSGACIMIRKELWDSIGGFDERYSPAYYEDTDLAMEVRKRGFQVMYEPDSVVVHFEGVSCGRSEKRDTKLYQEINKGKFFKKWESVLKAEYASPGTIRPWRNM